MTTTSASGGDVCRLTVFGPDSRAELAVPVHVPVADLLPTLLVHLDQRLATTGLEHGGWVLQRLGEPPLDEDLGTAALGLYDGDIVHLRPRDEQLPPIDFDDIVDGVATAISDRADRWRPEYGRRLALWAAGLSGLLGLGLVLTAGSARATTQAAGGLAALLLIAGIVASRAFGDRAAAAVLNGLGMLYIVGAGLALPLGRSPIHAHAVATPPSLLAAGGYLCAAALIVRFTTTTSPIRWEAIASGAALVAAAALADVQFGLSAAGTCSLFVPLVLVVGYLAPTLAMSLVGIRVPGLPTNSDQFQEDLEPEPSTPLVQRANEADRYVTAIYAVIAVIATACLVVVAMKGGTAAPLFVLAVSAVLLLHCRELTSTRQRIAMLTPSVAGVTVLSVAAMSTEPTLTRALAGALFLAIGLMACVAAHVLPERRLIPHWGLAGDIAHWLAAAAILPLALQVTGAFTAAHHLWS